MPPMTRPTLRLIRGGRTDDDGRQSVDLYRDDTGDVRCVVWSLRQLLAAIRRHRPRRPGDPDWTFAVGRRRRLTVSTDGPGKFGARETKKAADGLVAEVTVHGALTMKDVDRLVRAFYSGSCDRPCHSRLSS